MPFFSPDGPFVSILINGIVLPENLGNRARQVSNIILEKPGTLGTRPVAQCVFTYPLEDQSGEANDHVNNKRLCAQQCKLRKKFSPNTLIETWKSSALFGYSKFHRMLPSAAPDLDTL
jgi:hypothetical protein